MCAAQILTLQPLQDESARSETKNLELKEPIRNMQAYLQLPQHGNACETNIHQSGIQSGTY